MSQDEPLEPIEEMRRNTRALNDIRNGIVIIIVILIAVAMELVFR